MGYTKVKFDDNSSKQILEDAESYESNHPTGDTTNSVPVAFLQTPGSYVVRIFPDVYRGRTRIARHTFLHFLNYKSPSTNQDVKLRVVNDRKLSNLLDTFSDSDLGNEKFKFEAKEYSIMLARVYQYPKEDTHMAKLFKDNKDGFVDMLLVLKPRIMREISSRIGELKPSQVAEFLDIDTKTFGLKINLTKVSNNENTMSWIEAEVSITPDQYEMGLPKFAEGVDYNDLENAYIPESKVITDSELTSLQLYLHRLKERNASYIESRTKDGFANRKPVEEPGWSTDSYSSGALDDDIPF